MVPGAGLDVWGGLSGEAEVGERGGAMEHLGERPRGTPGIDLAHVWFRGTDSSGGFRVRVPNPRSPLGLSSRSATSHHSNLAFCTRKMGL